MGRVEQRVFPELQGAWAPEGADGLVSGFLMFFSAAKPLPQINLTLNPDT